jgi:E2/UBC family protein E
MNKKITIHINQEPYHFEKSELTPQAFRDTIGAPNEYEVWLVVKSPDPEGELPKDDIQITGPAEIENGQRYRVVPPGTFGLVNIANEIVLHEVDGLKELGYDMEIAEADGFINLIFKDYLLPTGYNKASTSLLLRVPVAYPNGNPDMFWTDVDLLCVDGRTPKSAESIEIHVGKQWRRFSWHPQNWNPGTGNLRMYLGFVGNGFAQACK